MEIPWKHFDDAKRWYNYSRIPTLSPVLSLPGGWLDCCFNQPKEHFAVSSENPVYIPPAWALPTSTSLSLLIAHLQESNYTKMLAHRRLQKVQPRERERDMLGNVLFPWGFELQFDFASIAIDSEKEWGMLLGALSLSSQATVNDENFTTFGSFNRAVGWRRKLFEGGAVSGDWTTIRLSRVQKQQCSSFFFEAHCIIKLNSCQRLDNLPFRLKNNCSDRPTKKKERILLF